MSSNNTDLPPLPADHLSHPENWATGSEPITKPQAGFIETLEAQKPELVPEGGVDTDKLTKSDASEVINKLKSGEKLEVSTEGSEANENGGKKSNGPPAEGKEEVSAPSKRKAESSIEKQSKSPAREIKATGANGTKSAVPVDNGSPDGPPSPLDIEADSSRPSKKAKTVGDADDKAVDTNAADDSAADRMEVDTPPNEQIATPAEPTEAEDAIANGTGKGNGAGTNGVETTPGDEAHLEHPENWATGDQPATDKQKGFIKVLEKQKGAGGVVGDVESLGKSEASEKIDELKKM